MPLEAVLAVARSGLPHHSVDEPPQRHREPVGRAGYPLTLGGDGRRRLPRQAAAQVARRMGVTTQVASEMFRRLGRTPSSTSPTAVGRPDQRGRAAADATRATHSSSGCSARSGAWVESDEEAARPGARSAAGRGSPRRDAGPSADLSPRQPDRRRDGPPLARARRSARSRRACGRRSTGSPRRPRTPACSNRGEGPHQRQHVPPGRSR
jgi:hypothetical protein